MAENEPSPSGRRRMGGIPPLPVSIEPAAVGIPKAQTGLVEEPGQAAPASEPQVQTSAEVNVPGPAGEQQRTDRRRMVGPSVAPLKTEAAQPLGTAGPPDNNGKSTEVLADAAQAPTSQTAAEPTPAHPAPARRMGAPVDVAAGVSPQGTQAQAGDTSNPAGTRLGSDSEQRPAAPLTENASRGRSLLANRSRLAKGAMTVAGVVLVFLAVVLLSRWLRTLSGVEEFIADYSGHAAQPAAAPAGIPGWLGWQHFLNMFFMVLIVRTGLQVRWERRPPGYWTAEKGSFFSPWRQTPKKISLTQWLHQALDVLWVLNGLVFIVLLFITDHWMRIVPTSWDIFPHMLSAGLQYASLDWPDENGWVHYNALQVMAYFITVMIAAPLAVLSGLRLSTWWPTQNEKLSKLYPVEIARAVHIPVMIYFVLFTIVHVFLVFFTGARRNLNHMFTSRDVVDALGLVVFLGSLIVIAAGWLFTSQMFARPVAAKMGKVSKN